jgi:hypothetical protein
MDDLALTNGRRILANARGDLSYHNNEQLQGFQSQLDRSQADLENHATYAVVNGQAVLNDARKSLDNRINLILGKAMQTAGLFGVEVPSPSELATRRTFPPPEIVAVDTGVVEPTQSLAGLGGGGGQYRPICDVHLVDASIRQAYVWLCKIAGNIVSVCPEPISYVAGNIEKVRRYPHWWCAELACRLHNDCKWDLQEVLSYSDAIDAVQLFNGETGFAMSQFCEVLPKLFDEWRALHHIQVPKPSRPGEIQAIGEGQTLPDGYCLWCDAQGVKHVYPCDAETVPTGWKRC